MTPVNEALLTLLRMALGRPQTPPELSAEQWGQLLHLAEAHKLLPMIFEAGHPQLQRTDPGMAAAAKRRVRELVILQTLRTGAFAELYRELEKAGITPLVVKGIVCRQLYPKPDHRPSSDEDVLIPPEQFPLCHQVLTRLGFQTAEPDPAAAYEVPYRKGDSPLYIELHKHLFPPRSDAYGDLNQFFPDPFRHAASLEVHGCTLRTLAPTDHMTYLLLHAFKHFLHSGFGIRQICDILLFAQAHIQDIDWEHVRSCCRCVRAETFSSALFAIGVRHLGFAPMAPWDAMDVDELPLLGDVLASGVYGSADPSRTHSSTITLEAVISQKQHKSSRGSLLSAAFPPAQMLEGRYPWLKERHYLLPAAWASRMVTYLLEARSHANGSPSDALRIGSERLALLKRYDILE